MREVGNKLGEFAELCVGETVGGELGGLVDSDVED